MKIVRCSYQNKILWGVIEETKMAVLKNAPWRNIEKTDKSLPLTQVKLMPPSIPSKIILAGLNYKNHAEELDMPLPEEPVIFLKPPTALIGPQDDIIYPEESIQVDYEGELALVIKKGGRDIPEQEVKKHILGYTCLNDVTARDLQKKDGQWTRAKSFDTFCPVGPWIETDLDPSSVRIKTYVNGKIKQNSNTAHFIFSVNKLVSFISRIMTLCPGDIISTGTPPGVGPVKVGDRVTIDIEGIGELINQVVAKK
jgi:2-keto-4-pentenoate hydratase/2-oxohepta-3-ene-1,7-dioic acid hydratase in catechol pathway